MAAACAAAAAPAASSRVGTRTALLAWQLQFESNQLQALQIAELIQGQLQHVLAMAPGNQLEAQQLACMHRQPAAQCWHSCGSNNEIDMQCGMCSSSRPARPGSADQSTDAQPLLLWYMLQNFCS
jgi:hypothetical protein